MGNVSLPASTGSYSFNLQWDIALCSAKGINAFVLSLQSQTAWLEQGKAGHTEVKIVQEEALN